MKSKKKPQKGKNNNFFPGKNKGKPSYKFKSSSFASNLKKSSAITEEKQPE